MVAEWASQAHAIQDHGIERSERRNPGIRRGGASVLQALRESAFPDVGADERTAGVRRHARRQPGRVAGPGILREHRIAEDSRDGITLLAVERALQYVTVLRMGDPFPTELRTGAAS